MLCRQQDNTVFLSGVGFLSNLFSHRLASPQARTIGLVSESELREAMAAVLAGPSACPDSSQIHAFLESAKARGVDVRQTRIIKRGSKTTYAVLPSLMPGRTLLLVCGTPADALAARDAAELVRHCVREYDQADVSMLQALVDPEDVALMNIFRGCGFDDVAQLAYLECPAQHGGCRFPCGIRLETYSELNHADFAAAIEASYEQTLDCPALNGVRSTEDIIAGHKAAGEFNPYDWFLVRDGNRPAGVMILAKIPATDAMDLVYIGLALQVRKRGWASQLMKMAVAHAADRDCGRLTTAVDTRNTPAMKLYLRLGMQRIGVRTAMVKVLHRDRGISSTIHPQTRN